MDPVSLAASVFTLGEAVGAGGKLLAKLRSCRHAPPEIARIRAEVDRLNSLLENVRHYSREHSAHNFNNALIQAVEVATGRIESVNKILTSSPFKLKALSDKKKAYLTFWRYKDRLEQLERQIRDCIQDIICQFCLVTAFASAKFDKSVDVYHQLQKSSTNTLIASFKEIAINHFNAVEKTPDQDAQDPMTRIIPQERRPTDASVSTLPEYSLSVPSQHDSAARFADYGFKKQHDCRPGCSCACHIKREIRSPWLLSSIMGELSIHWRSQKPDVECNCSGHSGLAMIYRFPQYLLQRYLSMVLQMTEIDGPEFVLRVPRVLPWSHILWRYSVSGDLMAIRRMYADKTASPYDVDPAGRNALLYASKQQNPEVAHFLLTEGVDSSQPDSQGKCPSEALLRRSFGGVFGPEGKFVTRRILKGEDSIEEFGFTDLHKIVLGYNVKQLHVVLDATCDSIHRIDSLGRTALFWAVICDHARHVNLLLSYGAKVNFKDARGYTPLDFVRGPQVAQLLIQAGARININPHNYDHSSLHEHVIENGSADVISVFAALKPRTSHDSDFDIDIRDHDHETPLLNSIYAGNYPVVARLVDLGANVNQANLSSRDSALHFSAHFDRPMVLRLLLEHSASTDVAECNGRNLAHAAARTGGAEFITVLRENSAKLVDDNLAQGTCFLDARDDRDMTPAMYMAGRKVRSDSDVGVHEAWEDFEAAVRDLWSQRVRAPPAYEAVAEEMRAVENVTEKVRDGVDGDAGMKIWEQEDKMEIKIPGAFPTVVPSVSVVTVQEVMA